MAKFYAIKSVFQGKLTNVADEQEVIDLDFVNTFNQERSADSIEARANGLVAVTLEANVKYTFKVGMEVVTEPVLAMLMGAEYDEETQSWSAGESAPTKVYKYEGVVTLAGDDGTKLVKKMVIGKCSPVINNAIDFSAIDLSTFELTFNMMVDEDEFFKVTNNA